MSITDRIAKGLDELIDFYAEQKRRKQSTAIVVQGRSFSAAPEFQLRLAKLLFSDGDNKRVLVDYPISFGKYKTESGKDKAKTIYGDIVVTEGDVLKGVIEIKIDLGFLNCKRYGLIKENGKYHYDKVSNEFKRDYDRLFRSKKFSYRYPVGARNSELRCIKIPRDSENITKILLLVTRRNHHGRFDAFREAMEDASFCFLCLLNRLHPNDYPEKDDDLHKWTETMKRRVGDELRTKRREIDGKFRRLLV